MKRKIIYLILLFCTICNNNKAQDFKQIPQFKFYLAFEDAVGNKDTIYVGYDDNGTLDLDNIFGEINIKSTPFDSIFEVRGVNLFHFISYDGFLDSTLIDFHTKTQIIKTPCITDIMIGDQIIPILIKAKNFPINVKWQYPDTFLTDSCLTYSLFNPTNPVYWWDVLIPYLNLMDPNSLSTYLKDYSGSFTFDSIYHYDPYYFNPYAPFPEFFLDSDHDTITLLYLALIPNNGYWSNVAEIDITFNFKIYPNPANDYVIIENESNFSQINIEIIDIFGKSVLQKNLFDKSSTINLQEFESGIYFLKINKPDNSSVFKLMIVK